MNNCSIVLDKNRKLILVGKLEILLSDFPTLRSIHNQHCPTTLDIEAAGQHVVTTFMLRPLTKNECIEFIKSVTKWGGISYYIDRTLEENWNQDSLQHFRKGLHAILRLRYEVVTQLNDAGKRDLKNVHSRLEEAVSHFISGSGIAGLRIPSGSKVVRMLCPEFSAVFDSFVGNQFGFTNYDGGSTASEKATPSCYADYSISALKVAGFLNTLGEYPNPCREKGLWITADIDAAIFAKLRQERGEWLE